MKNKSLNVLRDKVTAAFAAQMIKANDDWFASLTKEQQEDYIEDHPNSKYAKDHKKKEADADKKYEQGHISDLKKNIRMIEQDIREIEADGDDASRERKHLRELKTELQSLTG